SKHVDNGLRHFIDYSTAHNGRAAQARFPTRLTLAPAPPSTPGPSQEPALASDQRPIKIVPKGLRSFDANDADFFLELLPGPRDRVGLPDSIRWWKTKIVDTDAIKTFSVAPVYGPLVCGSSS